ncbi:MAG TPA: GTP-binding protein [Firmicutes bacterium]|jgi:ribosomal protection tetracycline resistance protein|nr:TetM/TetW/TetO/TetS family tetracycline resistance ribosomal protection protein [Bacillota bacterium]HHT41853.1 GTP-binding protein [Bacillota bacterium]
MRRVVVGILAHVDAGKTTLSESMLYLSGKIQRLGRVDKKDAYLDTHDLERARGITIFSKQAIFEFDGTEFTLLDTPGHVDFSTEMERTLQVLDCAILVISGADGVQGHTATIWRLLSLYKVPVFLFVNKMDQPQADRQALLADLRSDLDHRCTDFGSPDFLEQVALCDEGLMDEYLEEDTISHQTIQRAIAKRQVFPVYFGSALRVEGVEEFLEGLAQFVQPSAYPQRFGARVFKVSRDEQGSRLTHLKITGGTLRVRDAVSNGEWEEKVNQIRLYSGEKYEVVQEIGAGAVCAVVGLSRTKPGEGLGVDMGARPPVLEPVLSYRIILPAGCDARTMLAKLSELEEEDPELRIVWDEQLQEIQAQLMGDVQTEVLQSLIEQRFDVQVQFDEGRILYKETIANVVEGVGHFEPLRHYAEVHLLLEPGERGSGLEFALDCSEDLLAKNWQRLILTHLQEKTHVGVLTGSPITDLKITVAAGRAHKSHTEGGDFREATYRAVRQGLKEAQSVLLEPYYSFRLEIPEKQVGRAMSDIEKMQGVWEIASSQGQMAVLVGSAPVVNMRNYHKEVAAYTRGLGRLSLSLEGYRPCHNAQEVIASFNYDSERDVENPTGSIFCAGGTGFYVPWDEVKRYMHVEPVLPPEKPVAPPRAAVRAARDIADDEDLRYWDTTANRGRKVKWKRRTGVKQQEQTSLVSLPEPREEYLLVDGYNVIHAWPELQDLAQGNMDAARMRLLDALSSYQGIKKNRIIVVFDAYRVQNRAMEESHDYHNIHVVFTKEAQTADEYIEKFAHDHKKKYDIVVATSDALQQVIIRSAGCALLSARELREEIEAAKEQVMRTYLRLQRIRRSSLQDSLATDIKKRLEDLRRDR